MDHLILSSPNNNNKKEYLALRQQNDVCLYRPGKAA